MELALSITIPTFSRYLEQNKHMIEDFLAKLLPTETVHNHLFSAIRYSVLNNGKRLRPTLVYATGQMLGISLDRLHAPAAAIELIHCYSLVHDDLPAMDDDDLRRGMPTCHKAFNEATAILAGDALQSLAFQILSDPELNPVPASQQVKMINILAQASGPAGMVLGQAQDIAAEDKALGLQDIITLHKNKTGALFNACIELAMFCAPSPIDEDTQSRLRLYAEHLGLAFQIHDDVLDVIGEENIIGKPIGSDQKLAKSTFTSLLGVDGAKQKALENLNLALQAIETFGDKSNMLTDIAKYLISRTH